MKLSKVFVAFGAALCVLAVSAFVVAGVPDDKKEIKIDQVAGKKGAVTFSHAKHAVEYKTADGKAISCKKCHHTAATDTPEAKDVKACSACHVKEGEAQKEHAGKKAPFVGVKKGDKFDKNSVIFHTQCVECHKTQAKADEKFKKIKSCKACHK